MRTASRNSARRRANQAPRLPTRMAMDGAVTWSIYGATCRGQKSEPRVGQALHAAPYSHERRDPPDRDPAILRLRRLRRHFQILIAVSLGNEVFGGDVVGPGQHLGDRLGATVGEDETAEIGADRVGVTLDQEDLA